MEGPLDCTVHYQRWDRGGEVHHMQGDDGLVSRPTCGVEEGAASPPSAGLRNRRVGSAAGLAVVPSLERWPQQLPEEEPSVAQPRGACRAWGCRAPEWAGLGRGKVLTSVGGWERCPSKPSPAVKWSHFS